MRLAVIALVAVIALARPAVAADPLGVGHTHDGDVGEFYLSWRQPLNRNQQGERIQGCCGGTDCRPILQIREHKGKPAIPIHWDALVKLPYQEQEIEDWLPVPDNVWEDAQPDPRESPNAMGHLCATASGQVICAVRAADF